MCKAYKITLLTFALCLFQHVLLAQNLEQDLILHYSMDGSVQDLSGSGNNGTLIGPVAMSDRNGVSNGALLFDGVNDMVRMPDDFLPSSSAFSISMWVRVDGINAVTTMQQLFDLRDQYNFGIAVFTDNPTYGTEFYVSYKDNLSTPHALHSVNDPIYGEWYHLAVTYDGSTLSLFINGSLDVSTSGLPALQTMNAGDNNLGKDYKSSLDRLWLNGAMDEVRVYSRALTAGEVTTLSVYDPNAEQAASEILSGYGFYGDDQRFGIGTEYTHGYRLAVAGGILAEEVKVQLQSEWADYVFSDDYPRYTINELSNFIQANKHLPNIPSADAVAENGIELGEMNRLLLEKIEELTLYVVELKAESEQQQTQLDEQAQLIKSLQASMEEKK